MQITEPLIRWTQYRWENKREYICDLDALHSAYVKLSDRTGSDSIKVFRGTSSELSKLNFVDGSSIQKEIAHECWTSCEKIATRFALKLEGGFVKSTITRPEKVLFDVEVLVKTLPIELVNKHYDLQNLEREVVLVKEE